MSKKKLILTAFLATILVGGCVLGGFYGCQAMGGFPKEESSSAPLQEGVSSGQVLTGMLVPENDADVLDYLYYAHEKSPDVAAWLRIPDTDINNVVMQGSDNYYYERRNEDGEHDVYGCYFADYECRLGARDDFSQNTVIYGHGNSDDDPTGQRFSQLFKFADIEFAQQHPYIYLDTLQGKYVFEIFTVFYTDISFDYIRVNIDPITKLEIARQAQALSLYDYPVKVEKSDVLLTLSTCSGADAQRRFVVMGRLCPLDFEEAESVSLTALQ